MQLEQWEQDPRAHRGKGENIIIVGAQGLGKTMLAKNLVHQAVMAGHSARFLTAADLVLDLNGQDTSRALERRLRAYARPHVLAIDEIGDLAYDAHAADLLFQIVSRRYDQKSFLVTTNLPFTQWDTIFPNASCAVALIDRLTHHAEIIPIEGDSYRRRDDEAAIGYCAALRDHGSCWRTSVRRRHADIRPAVDVGFR